MTVHRLRYEGPATLAVEAARMLADADGIVLTGSEPPVLVEGSQDRSILVLEVDGTSEAVTDAAQFLRDRLPDDATIVIEEPPPG